MYVKPFDIFLQIEMLCFCFSICVSIWVISVEKSSKSLILLLIILNVVLRLSKWLFTSVTVVLFLAFPFFSYGFHLCWNGSYYSTLSISSTGDLNTLIIVNFKCLPQIPKSWSFLSLIVLTALSLDHV